MDIIKSIRVYNEDGTISDSIPLSVDLDKVRIPEEIKANIADSADFLDQQLINFSNDIETKADKSISQIVDLSSSSSANLSQSEIGVKNILPIEKGGTEANSAVNARINLDVPSNSQLNTVYNQANNAYNQANAGRNQANSAYNKANDAWNLANNSSASAAYTQANNAMNKANEAINKAELALTQSTGSSTGNTLKLGANSSAGSYSVALGASANATASYSVAIGQGTRATGDHTTAIGHSVAATGANCVIIETGGHVACSAINAVAIGARANCTGNYSVALGAGAIASNNTIQLGDSNISSLKCRVTVSTTSDARDKADIECIKDGAVDFLNKIYAVQYVLNEREKYIDDYEKLSDEDKEKKDKYGICSYNKEEYKLGTKKGSRKRVGVIAQQVQQALKEVYGDSSYANIIDDSLFDIDEEIPDDIESKLSANYSAFIPFLIKAIQELDERLSKLENK